MGNLLIKTKLTGAILFCAYLGMGLPATCEVAALAPTSDMGEKAGVRITRRTFINWLAMAAGVAAVAPSALIPVKSADLPGRAVTKNRTDGGASSLIPDESGDLLAVWEGLIQKFVEHPAMLFQLENDVSSLLMGCLESGRRKQDLPDYWFEISLAYVQRWIPFDPKMFEAAKKIIPRDDRSINAKAAKERLEAVINNLEAAGRALEVRPAIHERFKSFIQDPVGFQIGPEARGLFEWSGEMGTEVQEKLIDEVAKKLVREVKIQKEKGGRITSIASFLPQEALARLIAHRTLHQDVELWVEWRDHEDLPIAVLFWQEGSEKEHLFILDAHRGALAKLIPAGKWPVQGLITRIIFKPNSSYPEVLLQIKEAIAEALFAATELSRAPSFVDAQL